MVLTLLLIVTFNTSSMFLFYTYYMYNIGPPYRTSDLRQRGHPFQLPDHCTDLHKKSFIV